ncbi:MAG: hypothetical protein EBU92_07750 [Betaproteobacteria bacterium]|nr:hypothetical protein [Betaproteobacteria bacterium]
MAIMALWHYRNTKKAFWSRLMCQPSASPLSQTLWNYNNTLMHQVGHATRNQLFCLSANLSRAKAGT